MTQTRLDAMRPTATSDADTLLERYRAVRARTEELAQPLGPEDQVIQSMPDCSPTKWHRGHTTWFFEEFLLSRLVPTTCRCTRRTGICSTATTRRSVRASLGHGGA